MMITQMQDFVAGKAQGLNDQLTRFGHETIRSVRRAASDGAQSLKALKTPVRTVARGGVRFSTVSQTAVQALIELQSEALSAALNEFALRLERAARAAGVVELVRDQVELMPATRERLAADAGRVVEILASAGRGLKDVAAQTYERVTDTTEKTAPARGPRAGRKKTVRRARSRKAAA